MGDLGLTAATSSSEMWSDFLGSMTCPWQCCELGLPPAPALADALQVSAVSPASVLTQPWVLFTPCSAFLRHACENVSLVSEFCFAPFCPDFSSHEV